MAKIFKISMVFVFIISFTLLFGQGISKADTVLFQDNFNTENGGVGVLNYTGFANWTVSAGTVDLIGQGSAWDFYPGNGLYVDLDGSSSDAGILTTDTNFTFLQNIWYELTFDLGGNARNYPDDIVTMTVSFANQTYTVSSGTPLATRYFSFMSPIADYTTPIVFSNADGDNVGAILDNVKLVQVTGVPEPTTMLLLGLGLVGLAGIRRKMK